MSDKCIKPKEIEWQTCEECGNDQFKIWTEDYEWNAVCMKCGWVDHNDVGHI